MSADGRKPDPRIRWSKKWAARPGGPQAIWRSSAPPAGLRDLLPTLDLPVGGALDVGCGDGVTARFLGERFRPTVGIDIAYDAVRIATEDARRENSAAVFVAGDVTAPPFPDASFSFLFDRGTFHKLPRELHAPYFEAMERILRPNGVLFLMAASDVHRKGWSKRVLKRRIARLLGFSRTGKGPSEDEVRRLVPASFAIVDVRREKHKDRQGTVFFNRFVFRKRDGVAVRASERDAT